MLRFKYDNDTNDHSSVIRQSRQCITIGSVYNMDELIRVWMVRPTINYSTYVIVATSDSRDYIANMCVRMLRALANYNIMELSIKCPPEKPNIIEISGTMAHYYMPKVRVRSTMKHVSLGGSVIRAHQVRDFNTSPKIVDICMNMDILTSLVSGVRSGIGIEITPRSVKLKYHTSMSFGLGPSLIMGCNGGFQWLGNPTNIAESLCGIFAFMSSNIMKTQFVSAISKSTSMQQYIYPAGIQRHKQTHMPQRTI